MIGIKLQTKALLLSLFKVALCNFANGWLFNELRWLFSMHQR